MTTHKKAQKKAVPVKGKPHHQATAASILGHASTPTVKHKTPPKVKIKPQWEPYHKNLLVLRDRLVSQMDGLAKETTEEIPTYSLHMADSGTDNFDRDFALSLLSSDQDAIYEIEEALKRIEKNTYGVCELTGKSIPKARLQAIPWTRFTLEAQAQLERDGALRHQRRLGNLGTVDNTSSAESEGEEEEAAEEKPPVNKEKE